MMGYLSIQRLRFVSSCLILDRLILFASFATFAAFVRLFVCSFVRLFVCLFVCCYCHCCRRNCYYQRQNSWIIISSMQHPKQRRVVNSGTGQKYRSILLLTPQCVRDARRDVSLRIDMTNLEVVWHQTWSRDSKSSHNMGFASRFRKAANLLKRKYHQSYLTTWKISLAYSTGTIINLYKWFASKVCDVILLTVGYCNISS